MTEEPRTYVTMAGKSIGQCSSGHWLPLRGDCDLCGAGPHEKCRYTALSNAERNSANDARR